MKKIYKITIWIAVIALVLYLAPKFIFGFDYVETFSTRYSSNDSTKTIYTRNFKIVTPKNWIHIFHGYGEEGESVGSFYTGSGLISYEYGMFANPFEVDSIFVFSNDTLTANRFWINIGYNQDNETGIHIPRQKEMDWPLSFFMSKSCTENMDDIISGLKQMEFRKSYSITWENEEYR